MSRKILVVAPHSDDEIIGVGGSLLKWKALGNRIQIVLVACSDIYMRHIGGTVDKGVREKEFIESCSFLSTEPCEIFGFEDSKLDTVPIGDIVQQLDQILTSFKPNTVLFPEPSYHQDHQVVNKACTASLRPTIEYRPEKVMLYEIPTSSWTGSGLPFQPNYYVDISKTVEEKLNIFESVYRSQFTSVSRFKLAANGIRDLSKCRGFEAGVDYAEAFKLIHCVDK